MHRTAVTDDLLAAYDAAYEPRLRRRTWPMPNTPGNHRWQTDIGPGAHVTGIEVRRGHQIVPVRWSLEITPGGGTFVHFRDELYPNDAVSVTWEEP